MSSHKFSTLDGLRGIAALLIAIRHAPQLWPLGHPTSLFYQSYLSVDFFFMLSGFVLAHAYGPSLQKGTLTFSEFVLIRLIRLYPLYFISILGFYVLILVRQGFEMGLLLFLIQHYFFYSLFLLPNFSVQQSMFPANNPSWSLFYEICANFVMGLLSRYLTTLILCFIILCAGLALMTCTAFHWLGFGSSNGAFDTGTKAISFYGTYCRVIFSFFLGILLYRLWKINCFTIQIPAIIPLILLLLVLIAPPFSVVQPLFDILAVMAIFPLIILLGAQSQTHKKTDVIVTLLGRLSYAIYILQDIIYALINYLLTYVSSPYGSLLLTPMALLAVFLIAYLFDRFYDKPLRRLLTQKIIVKRVGSISVRR